MTTNNRELSWIDFNARVLQEVNDKSNPLVERIRFLGIFSNNRDEFFKVRIATLRRMILLAKKNSEEKEKLSSDLDIILQKVVNQEKIYTNSFANIINELEEQKIFIVNEKNLSPEHQNYIIRYYNDNIHQSVFPLILDNANASQMLNDNIMYMAISLTSSNENAKPEQLLIEVPRNLPRFIELETADNSVILIFIEDILRFNLLNMFKKYNYDKAEGYILKFTRDSELNIDNDVSKSFLEIMSESVKKRHKGIPVRFIFDGAMPSSLLNVLIKKLNITTKNYQIRGGGRYHNFKDLMNFPSIRKELLYKPIKALSHPNLNDNELIFQKLKQRDILLNFPYHSFHHIIDFLREASIDPKVRSIKMSFYRAGSDSLAMNALINAARNGKRVTVFMELQARFDEQANIKWTQKLQSEGVTVLPTIPGVKVHAKLILIRRKQSGKNFYYTNISTGNFNEATAKIYSDFSLLTANQKIGQDAHTFFELIESRYIAPTLNTLHISPFHIRTFLETKIKAEISNKRKGLESWILFKVNNLVDPDITNLLYKAGQKGVKIDLNIRGISVIKTGVKGFSDNINSYSIVGRFLEHSRIFVFANGGDTEVYLSSADIMSRNLDHRFEVVYPILDKILRDDILKILNLQRNDTVKYRSLNEGEINKYIRKNMGNKELNSQEETYNYWKQKCDL